MSDTKRKESYNTGTIEPEDMRPVLNAILETASEAIITVDSSGIITSWNHGAIRLFGYESTDIIGKSATILMPRRYHKTHRAGIKRLAITGVQRIMGETVEIEGLTKDGTEVPIELTLSTWSTERGQYFSAIIRDVRKRKETEQFRKALIDNSTVGIYLVQNGVFVFVNDQFQKHTGYTKEELLNTESLRIVHPDDRELVRDSAKRMLNGEASDPYEFRVVSSNGRNRWVMETVSSVTHDGKRAVLGNFMDISEHKRAEAERERLIQELQEALADVRTLSGLLPICAWCKNMRDEQGYWESVEAYISKHTHADFSHGICPDCAAKYFPNTKSKQTQISI